MRINVIDSFSGDLDRLRGALEASCVVGTWEWDHIRGVVIYDAGAAKLLTTDAGLADKELYGGSAIAAVHPADEAWLIEHMRRAVGTGGLVMAEYRVFTDDGSVRWLLSRGRTYEDQDGRPHRSCGIIIDITEVRDGGERYVRGDVLGATDPLERAADLAIALKQTLAADMSPDLHTAADLLLLQLGRAIARAEQGHCH